jgi:hypothetical protein
MSAIGTKQTWDGALQMSAIGDKANMPSSDGAKVKIESVRQPFQFTA